MLEWKLHIVALFNVDNKCPKSKSFVLGHFCSGINWLITYINVFFILTGLDMSKYKSLWTHFYSTGEVLAVENTEVAQETPRKRGRPRKHVVSPQSPGTSKSSTARAAKITAIKTPNKSKKSSEYLVTFYTVYYWHFH